MERPCCIAERCDGDRAEGVRVVRCPIHEAAPALLAACKEAQAFMVNHYRNRPMGLVPLKSLEVVEQAIALAEPYRAQ